MKEFYRQLLFPFQPHFMSDQKQKLEEILCGCYPDFFPFENFKGSKALHLTKPSIYRVRTFNLFHKNNPCWFKCTRLGSYPIPVHRKKKVFLPCYLDYKASC